MGFENMSHCNREGGCYRKKPKYTSIHVRCQTCAFRKAKNWPVHQPMMATKGGVKIA